MSLRSKKSRSCSRPAGAKPVRFVDDDQLGAALGFRAGPRRRVAVGVEGPLDVAAEGGGAQRDLQVQLRGR